MKTYVIWFHIMLDNKQQIFRVSLHFAHISSLVSFHHPSPHWSLFFLPRINHYSVNVYCFVFINKNATTESSPLKQGGKTGWKIMFTQFSCGSDTSRVSITLHANVDWDRWKWMTIQQTREDAAPRIKFRKQKIIMFFPLWQQRGH